MSGEMNIVIMAGYQALEPAKKDFDELVALVKDKKIKTDGMILVQRNEDGQIVVEETGDHIGRRGTGWGGGIGFLVGLAAPPMLASVAIGAAGGAVVGRFAKHKMMSGIEGGFGSNLKPGMAAISSSFAKTIDWLPSEPCPVRRQNRSPSSTKTSRLRCWKRPASSTRTAQYCPSLTVLLAVWPAAPWPTRLRTGR